MLDKSCANCAHKELKNQQDPCDKCRGFSRFKRKDLPKDRPSEMPEPAAGSILDSQVGGSHYRNFVIQPAEFLARNHRAIPFAEGCIIKYAARHREKNGVEDLKKIIQYAKIIAEFEYKVKL